MFPEWNPYLMKINAEEHQRRIRHLERVAQYRSYRKRPR
jgi:hypothetical protein